VGGMPVAVGSLADTHRRSFGSTERLVESTMAGEVEVAVGVLVGCSVDVGSGEFGCVAVANTSGIDVACSPFPTPATTNRLKPSTNEPNTKRNFLLMSFFPSFLS